MEIERKYSKSFKNLEILKKEVIKKDKIINQLTNIESKRAAKQTGPSEEQIQQMEYLKMEVDKKSQDIQHLSNSIANKEKKIFELEQKLRELTNDFQDAHEKFLREKNELNSKCQAL